MQEGQTLANAAAQVGQQACTDVLVTHAGSLLQRAASNPSWQMQARCLHNTVHNLLTLRMSTAYTLIDTHIHRECMQEMRVYA